MKIILCEEGVCQPPKYPIVDVQNDKVTIGENENTCILTKGQFNILKEKIKNNEI